MTHHLWMKTLSVQQSRQCPKYSSYLIGYPGLEQSLNAKCGVADASTSTEIRNYSPFRHYTALNPRGQVQITVDLLIKPPSSTAWCKKKFNTTTVLVSFRDSFVTFFSTATQTRHQWVKKSVQTFKSVFTTINEKSFITQMCAAKNVQTYLVLPVI